MSDESRRDLLKKGVVGAGLVWTAPVVTVLPATPANAATPVDLCQTGEGYYVALFSPGLGATELIDRPNPTGAFEFQGCVSQDPLLGSSLPLAKKDDVGLTTNTVNIAHDISNLAQGTVELTLSPDQSCVITRVAAHVHQYGPPSFPNDCPQGPNSYGWDAGSPYLDIVAGSLGSQFIAVRPSLRTDLCSPYSLHWGSPNDQVSCQTGTGPSPNGQPFGFLIIEVGAP